MPRTLQGAVLAAMALTVGLVAPAGADPVAAMTAAGCNACHTLDKKLVGPAYKEIAARYKGQADAASLLVKKAREGGKGVWGPIPMPANPPAKIGDADLTAAVAWILQQ
jgi:cytochrome c